MERKHIISLTAEIQTTLTLRPRIERSERNSSTSSSPRGPTTSAPKLAISRITADVAHSGVFGNSVNGAFIYHFRVKK